MVKLENAWAMTFLMRVTIDDALYHVILFVIEYIRSTKVARYGT